jgi:glutamate formiminotransferase/formiminotetrahydrofolate cyclodeaminase
MTEKKIIECVPNFSEGRNSDTLEAIALEVKSVDGVKLLNVDPGKATNRTVFTFAGEPDAVIEAAFRAIKKATELINMTTHKGEHPRMGATDVCPLVPISGITMEETILYAEKLAQRVGIELDIPVYLYERSAKFDSRKNLANIREGEYESLPAKIIKQDWKPDYGPQEFKPKSGATAIGARDFLIAYNINLNTSSTRIANSIAFDVREQGRIKREGHPIVGEVVKDENGEPVRIPGKLKAVKAIGWYIEEYKKAQISMNLVDINTTPLHIVFDEVEKSATERGVRITGSEIVGMVPKKVLYDAGVHFLKKQKRSIGLPESEIIRIAIDSLGLNEISEFKQEERIIEYVLDSEKFPLLNLTIKDFAYETASESPAPGGGSISAYIGSLGAALSTMVANLSANKRGWENKTEYFSELAHKGHVLTDNILRLVDADTMAFNKVMEAMSLPKSNNEEINARNLAIELANIDAARVPLQIMKSSFAIYELAEELIINGNQNSLTDAGVSAICTHTCIEGAYYNVIINLKGMENNNICKQIREEANTILNQSESRVEALRNLIKTKLEI